MEPQTDPEFLIRQEYNQADALNTRINIQTLYSRKPGGRAWFHWLFDQLRDVPADGLLLELGCGPGTMWLENLNRLPAGWQMVLSDFSAAMVEEARQRLAGRPAFAFQLLDAQAIASPDNHFDVIIANGIYDHIPHRKQAFAETVRVLKPGGRLYASAGGRNHLQQLEELVRPFVPDANYGGAPERFGLENGQALLSAWFSDVKRADYEDTLIFREPYPIVAYILSEAAVRPHLTTPRLQQLVGCLQDKLAAEGEIHVTVQKGLFMAYKAPVALPEHATGNVQATTATHSGPLSFRPWCIANCTRYHHRTAAGRLRLPRKRSTQLGYHYPSHLSLLTHPVVVVLSTNILHQPVSNEPPDALF